MLKINNRVYVQMSLYIYIYIQQGTSSKNILLLKTKKTYVFFFLLDNVLDK